MIKFTWKGPLTTYKNRVLCPNREVELDPKDAQTQTWLAFGYLKRQESPEKHAERQDNGAAPPTKPDKKETK